MKGGDMVTVRVLREHMVVGGPAGGSLHFSEQLFLLAIYHLLSRLAHAPSQPAEGPAPQSDADATGEPAAAVLHPAGAAGQGHCAGGAHSWEEGPLPEACGIRGLQPGEGQAACACWERRLGGGWRWGDGPRGSLCVGLRGNSRHQARRAKPPD